MNTVHLKHIPSTTVLMKMSPICAQLGSDLVTVMAIAFDICHFRTDLVPYQWGHCHPKREHSHQDRQKIDSDFLLIGSDASL